MKIRLSLFCVLVMLAAGIPSPALFAQNDVNKPDIANQETEEQAEEELPREYTFTVEKSLECTDVETQGQTGTCWCFATASFIESELIRQGKGLHELSEMFVVKNIYNDKARNFLLRKGKTNFSEGALAHDFINAAGRHGLVPDEVYSGLINGAESHNHSEMAAVLEGMLEALVQQRRLSDDWDEAFQAVLDTYLGDSPQEFSYQGETYTPQSFAEHVGFNADNYVSYTSYTHHPFDRPFVLEIPDNFSNGSFHNVPIDQLVDIIDNAIANGYTVAWDGDVSEKGFSGSKGVAVLPADPGRRDALTVPGDELDVTQEMRQETFEEYSTTDDHLMHLVGIARDQHGTKYYIIKNSWGETGPHDGYLYMSEAYVRLKTVAILIHKDAAEAGEPASTGDAETASR
ncbi:MAG: aminopeptidase C [Pirellulaceae bacterium]